MSSLPVTIPLERQVSAVMSWRERYRTHLASKESKTGLPWEAQSRLHGGADEAQGKGGPGRGCCVSKAFWEILVQWGQRGIEDSEMLSWTVGCERPVGQPEELGLAVVGSKRRVSCWGVPRPGCGRETATLS